jgi:hypothetical protein
MVEAIAALAEKAALQQLTEDDVPRLAGEVGLSRGALYDALHLYLARGYAARELTYEFCDRAVNHVMGVTGYDVPDLAWEIFSAFDEGEYYHSPEEQAQEEDPAEKYTRPWIERVLKQADEGASPKA